MLPTRPARSGRTGQRPFGSTGDKIEVERYDEHFEAKVKKVKELLAAVPRDVLDTAKIFPSEKEGSQHRAGQLAIQRPSASRRSEGICLEFTMWDADAKEHSLIDPVQVPNFSLLIRAAMQSMRTMPIILDPEEDGWELPDSGRSSEWGKTLGHGLRAAQFHSTLSNELMVCLAYHDARLQSLKRGEVLPEEDGEDFESSSQGKAWLEAAKEFQSLLHQGIEAVGVRGSTVEVIGRWKRRRLTLDRDFVQECFTLEDGRSLVYKQPEGQFSNPNASCEVQCLNWLCQEAKEAGRLARGARRSPVLLELHSGGGNNTVAVAPSFGEVRSVEINRILAEAAEENLRMNKIANTRVVRAASADIEAKVYEGCDVALVDPPRAGLDERTREVVAQMEQILYISCNPEALASDLEYLRGFEVVSLAIFDMFPYTTHVECVVRLRRKEAKIQPVDQNWGKFVLKILLMLAFMLGGGAWGWLRKPRRRR